MNDTLQELQWYLLGVLLIIQDEEYKRKMYNKIHVGIYKNK